MRAARAQARCSPLHRHRHHHRNRQHHGYNHHHQRKTRLGNGTAYGNAQTAHRMIVIGERAVAMSCLFSFRDENAIQTPQLRDGRTKPCSGTLREGRAMPCAIRSVVAGRNIATGQSLVVHSLVQGFAPVVHSSWRPRRDALNLFTYVNYKVRTTPCKQKKVPSSRCSCAPQSLGTRS